MLRSVLLAVSLVLAGCAASAHPTPAAPARLTRAPTAPQEGLPRGDATREGIDPKALADLVAHAEAEHSDALILVKNGKLVYENYFGTENAPYFAMSASKSFVSLAYGFLLADKKLASLDERVSSLVPEFAADPRKAKVTYRHLLAQTSGLDPARAIMLPSQDIEATGIASACLFEPGTDWQYSNGGVDFLAALAGKLAGKPMDEYLNEKLFRPVGIGNVSWKTDQRGVPYGGGEMKIRPIDMATIGQVMLDDGRWKGVQIIPKDWIAISTASSNPYQPLYGLLWWKNAPAATFGLTQEALDHWSPAGVSETIASKVQPLVGRTFTSRDDYKGALGSLLSKDELKTLDRLAVRGLPWARILSLGPSVAYEARGWLGQYLIVVPGQRLVAVRMRRAHDADYATPETEVDGFRAFPKEVTMLSRP